MTGTICVILSGRRITLRLLSYEKKINEEISEAAGEMKKSRSSFVLRRLSEKHTRSDNVFSYLQSILIDLYLATHYSGNTKRRTETKKMVITREDEYTTLLLFCRPSRNLVCLILSACCENVPQ